MEDLVITGRLVVPARDLRWSASRAGGPGGQNVNKVASKVDLRFDLPGSEALTERVRARLRTLARRHLDGQGFIHITSQRTRDQARNLEDAREKLAALIRGALVTPKIRRKTTPSKASKRRRLEEKRRVSDKKAQRGRVRRDD